MRFPAAILASFALAAALPSPGGMGGRLKIGAVEIEPGWECQGIPAQPVHFTKRQNRLDVHADFSDGYRCLLFKSPNCVGGDDAVSIKGGTSMDVGPDFSSFKCSGDAILGGGH